MKAWMMFADRRQAGEKLAELLKKYTNEPGVVGAIPRGGVVLGRVIAKALGWPLELVLVRKVGHQYNPEYAVCAVPLKGLWCSVVSAYCMNFPQITDEEVVRIMELEKERKRE